uniref:Achaete-scute family bHLH transcription factor 4 n=1 Tax=Oryzias latipes TaxID=8090 RepID=H2M5S8_ORYLA
MVSNLLCVMRKEGSVDFLVINSHACISAPDTPTPFRFAASTAKAAPTEFSSGTVGMLPCGRLSYLPFRTPFGVCDYSFEPAFIQKRNERERHRVRCVNEGYARLREHLPQEFEDKRLSKVETLRAAIDYIKRLQSLLELSASGRHVLRSSTRGLGA